jgi:hypothetical protein
MHRTKTIGSLLLLLACSEAQAPETCATQHPAMPPVAEQTVVDGAVAACMQDDGECMASTSCTGTVEGRDCSADGLISADAAICYASAAGLSEGLDGYRVSLIYNVGLRRIIWSVANLEEDNSTPGVLDQRGSGFSVDAKTGEILEEFGWNAIS